MGVARVSKPLPPVPRPASLEPFVGMWVALKDDQVLAAAKTSRELVYEVHKLGDRGRGAVVQYVSPPSSSFMVGVG